MSKINLKEAEELLNFYIDNNRYLEDNGQTPVSISFVVPWACFCLASRL